MRRTREVNAEVGDEGQTTILVLGLSVICLLLATVILAITAVNIEARRLLSAADGAATAAAGGFIIELGPEGQNQQPILTDASAQSAVVQYLRAAGTGERLDDLAVQSVRVIDGGQTVEVVLTATAHPPIVNMLIPAGVTVVGTSSARTTLTR